MRKASKMDPNPKVLLVVADSLMKSKEGYGRY